MSETIDNEDAIMAIIASAVANAQRMDGTTRPLKALVVGADVAVAVWPSPGSPFGYGLTILKGNLHLAELNSDGAAFQRRIIGIMSESQEEALSWRSTFLKGYWTRPKRVRRRPM